MDAGEGDKGMVCSHLGAFGDPGALSFEMQLWLLAPLSLERWQW